MNILSGIISLAMAFWMFIYLYGLYAVSSAKYNAGLYVFPIIMLCISLYCFSLEVSKNKRE